MLNREVKRLITGDLTRFGGNRFSQINFISVFLNHPEFRILVMIRLSNFYSKWNFLGLIARVWYLRLRSKFGMQIRLNSQIGPGFHLNHWGPMNIRQGVTIGKNCNISQGVTIGNVSRGRKKGVPTIGDEVWIGTNAVVVGNILIGNNVLIAPLSYVNFDVPDNSVVMGSPGTVVSYRGSEGYTKNKI